MPSARARPASWSVPPFCLIELHTACHVAQHYTLELHFPALKLFLSLNF